MLVVGTRGDDQTSVAKKLQEIGHRVRLATHAYFHNFAKSNGIVFSPLGGDPPVLSGYMARKKVFFHLHPEIYLFSESSLRPLQNLFFRPAQSLTWKLGSLSGLRQSFQIPQLMFSLSQHSLHARGFCV